MSKESKKSIAREILDTLIYLAVVFVLTLLFITFVAQRTQVIGSSMNPTVYDSESLILEKVSYRFHDPKRFDIVVFPYEHGNKQNFIKRVIGLPGEKVRIDYDGNIYINGEILEENYGAEVIQDPQRAAEEITVPEGEFFVLGDNRNHSMDSRDESVGTIKKSRIMGRAVFRIFPLNKFGGIK
ncbi:MULTISPECIES: signal peptidase I [unclassified Butyrivibrio]|uniref:signal peptidase I n=1 Tax=unclassified Butyrivibrio TaxID=2639466 RepID=UPI0008EC8F51|nr:MULTISPECIES: signal peptidase I [unclassified Butyrivibrio]RKM62669.1 signal peptidase I [Butyrivibrio sp. XB500-5]SFU45944.1 signal peptidase I [Butyrivibrio sp. INlla21]